MERVIAADWGLRNVIRARTGNTIIIDNQGPKLTLGNFDKNAFTNCKTDCVIVTRTQNRNVFQFVPEVLASNLTRIGLSKTRSVTVYDTHGIPAFEIFQLTKTDQHR